MIDDKNLVRRWIGNEEVSEIWIDRAEDLPIRAIDDYDFTVILRHIDFVVAGINGQACKLLDTDRQKKVGVFSRQVRLGRAVDDAQNNVADAVRPANDINFVPGGRRTLIHIQANRPETIVRAAVAAKINSGDQVIGGSVNDL